MGPVTGAGARAGPEAGAGPGANGARGSAPDLTAGADGAPGFAGPTHECEPARRRTMPAARTTGSANDDVALTAPRVRDRARLYAPFCSIFAQLSRRPIVRFQTRAPGRESTESTQK